MDFTLTQRSNISLRKPHSCETCVQTATVLNVQKKPEYQNSTEIITQLVQTATAGSWFLFAACCQHWIGLRSVQMPGLSQTIVQDLLVLALSQNGAVFAFRMRHELLTTFCLKMGKRKKNNRAAWF